MNFWRDPQLPYPRVSFWGAFGPTVIASSVQRLPLAREIGKATLEQKADLVGSALLVADRMGTSRSRLEIRERKAPGRL